MLKEELFILESKKNHFFIFNFIMPNSVLLLERKCSILFKRFKEGEKSKLCYFSLVT